MMFELVIPLLVIVGFALFGYGMYQAGLTDRRGWKPMANRVKVLEEMLQEREQWIRELDRELTLEREAHQRTRVDHDAVLRGFGIPEGTIVTLNYNKQPTIE